jgi:hypothetical protein|tara:strand:+ start:71 stop:1282 length:1212 start_codon:yes stop_codon:yes gene_type:complete
MKMNDEIRNDIEKAAEILGMSLEDAMAKFEEICSKNNVSPDTEPQLARGLWKQFFFNSKSAMKRTTQQANDDGGLFKNAFGFFISLNEARDMGAMNRDRVTNEYMRDSEMTYNAGKVAIFTEDGDGYEARMVNRGNEVVKTLGKLPENHIEVDSGKYIVPLDTREGDWNKNYGKPLVKEEYRRSGVFIGEVNGQMGKWDFSYKGASCIDFEPKTFEFVHFSCIPNSFKAGAISGGTDTTLTSLVYNVDLPVESDLYVDVSEVSIQDALMQHCEGNYSPLIDIDRYHSEVSMKPYADRFVFTDGSVTSINMNPTANGNRIVNIDDLNTEIDWDGDGFSGTTCWIPQNVNIEFGIGSNIIVVGRTSQSPGNPTSINVSGLFVVNNRGGSPEEIEYVEEDEDWFFD